MGNEKKNEDIAPQSSSYQYAWSPDREADMPLSTFLTKYKPSMVQDDGTKPWIWVRGSKPAPEAEENKDAAIEEASELLKEVTEKVEKIKNDDSIPTRSNKKTGAKSKKELREAEQASATEKLKEISIRHGAVSGKWLVFAPSDRVDVIWSTVATSLVSGALSETTAYSAKVATCPKNEMPNYQHVLCIYLPDVYDKDAVTKVFRILLRQHGLNTSGVKSDLYTSIGLDSKHPSGIHSTVWKNAAVLPDSEIKSLKDAYFSELESSKQSKESKESDKPAAGTGTNKDAAPSAKAAAKPKTKLKPKLKKKAEDEDPFASDNDDDDVDKVVVKPKPASKSKPASKGRAKRTAGSDDDEPEKPQKKTKRARA